MKELFTGFFNVTLSCSLVILAVILLRLILKKAPKALICVMWGLVFLRLLIPVQIEMPFSLRPEMPTLSVADTSILNEETAFGFYPSFEAENEMVSEIPSFIPQQKLTPQDLVVDYVYIGALLWTVGFLGMLIYTVATYIRLRLRLREAVRLEKNVFASTHIDYPFLLGFFRPRIYLPVHMDEESRPVVVAHEQAHIRRGDNWFKLIAFICLALHWYNPLAWVAYSLLCRDIEGACDEAVIRNLDEQGRSDYSTALLNCEKCHRSIAGCPIAFGEVSVRKRILKVLNYKKPVVWVTVIAMVAVIFSGACLMTDPVDNTHPPYYKELTRLLGEPMDVVCEKLGFTVEEMGEEITRGIYRAPVKTVEYQGVNFELQLGFTPLNEDMVWVLYSFYYFAEYASADDPAFAEDTVKLAHHLYGKLGRGYQWPQADNQKRDPDRLRDITVEAVYDELDFSRRYSGTTIAGDYWDLSQISGNHVKKYLERVEASVLWNNMKGDQERNYHYVPNYYLSFSSAEEKENDVSKGWIRLVYTCGRIPGHYGTGDLEWEQEMNGTWWKKLQDWLK